MLIAASAHTATALARLAEVPIKFWVVLGLGVIAIVTVVVMLRSLAGANKVVLSVVTGLCLSIIGFSWIYERNEPTWATPAVSFLADFFPSKGTLERHR
jgi:hypothetical protein